jgi:DNA helicase TIP49 (TBP-interacting protein)
VQLLTPASVLAKSKGGDGTVTKEVAEEVSSLFLDAKASARILLEEQEAYVKQ